MSAFAILLFSCATAFAQGRRAVPIKFADLQKYDPAHESFRIEGYILEIYKCPLCPPNAVCKPCVPDNITIVDSLDWSDPSKLTRLLIYTDKADKFEIRKKYLLTVRVKGEVKTGQRVGATDLVEIIREIPQETPKPASKTN